MTIKEFDTVHQIFPTEIMEFKDIEIPQCVLDALQDEELGLTNFPYGVYTSKGNLHHRPEFALVNKQIQDCLDRWTISYKLMCDRLKVSLMWAVFSKAHSNASHPTHRHPYAAVCGILYLTDGVSTIFQVFSGFCYSGAISGIGLGWVGISVWGYCMSTALRC